jgi:hemerythrin-like domain-containing protein
MLATEIRRRVLQDHESLRTQLTELEALVERVRSGNDALLVALREETAAMLAFLRRHMEMEEQHLGPALQALRLEALERDHREQRELLEFATQRLHDEGRPGELVTADLSGLVELIREDMRSEESELLDPAVLRDDVGAVVAGAGR